ncbi:cysteine desulfurase [archaeon]|nr:MAG: cysteine desulfurase [archaeon]
MLYFDYGAGMPVDEQVFEAMKPFFTTHFGNPSSLHEYGDAVREAVEAARAQVVSFVGAGEGDKVVFTSGATESNNLALKGVARRARRRGTHIVTTNIEHWAVHTPLKALEKEGFEVTRVPVEPNGIVDADAVADAMTEETVLVSVMFANNEIGTVQPIKEIAERAHERNIPVHTDATAAVGRILVDANDCGADLITLSSNDIYGPKGMGALYIRRGVRIEPVMHGGGQEWGIRSGTENVAGIVGMGAAAELAQRRLTRDIAHLSHLQTKLIDGAFEAIPDTHLNGDRQQRVPNNVNFLFDYIEGEAMLLSLSNYGIAASTGSACSSKTLSASHVLSAIGQSNEEAHGSVQFNMGRLTTDDDIDFLLEKLPPVVDRLRRMSPLTPKGFFDR